MPKTSPTAITRVPLSNRKGQYAKLNTEDYERLKALGVTTTWFINANGAGREYVRVDYRGNLSMVARLILSDPSRQMVTYLDGDRTNLCRSNLKLGPSGPPSAAFSFSYPIQQNHSPTKQSEK